MIIELRSHAKKHPAAEMLNASVPERIRIPCLRRMLKMLMIKAKTMDTMDDAVLVCPIMPDKTLKVWDMSTRNSAAKTPRVPTAKFEITKEIRNSLLEAFSSALL